MTSKDKKLTSIQLNDGDVVRLQIIAAELGYIQTRGQGSINGAGSVSQLMQAIAAGEVKLSSGRT
jgi:hypothetical protein